MCDVDPGAPPPSAALLQALSAHPDQLADVIAALSPSVHDHHSLLFLLRRVAASAVAYLDGVTAAGITAQLGGPPVTVADSGERLLLDEYHLGAGDGPCLRAMRTGSRVGVSSAEIGRRWPLLGDAATALGLGSVLAVPLQLDGPAAAALSLYSTQPSVPEPDADTLTVLTEYTQRGIAAYQRRRQPTDVRRPTDADGRELQQAVAGWTAVEQAVGILMQQYGFSAPYAREVLGDLAQDWQRTLIDQAVHIITTGSA